MVLFRGVIAAKRMLALFGVLLLCAAGVRNMAQSAASPATGQSAPEQAATPNPVAKLPVPAEDYVGDAACRSCHLKESTTYAETAHHRTSRLPTAESIEGSFSPGSNILHTADPRLVFQMQAAGSGFTQTALYVDESSKLQTMTEPFDIVVGSGRKGVTYLFWKGDELYELPVSYWVETHSWINSPGYPDGTVHFDKAIVPRCLECHGSIFQSLAPPLNRYRRDSLVLGISCEKCHGPGRTHVMREQSASPPRRGSPQEAIVNPAKLPRDRQIDLCSLCHAGPADPIAPTLSYLPGDDIHQFLHIPDPGPNAPIDVHANQVQLMQRSRCFQSGTLTCSTCHNVHQPQRDAASFAVHCLDCHKVEACGKFHEKGEGIRNRCIDCHMPLQKSDVLFSVTAGQQLNPSVRTHRIAIYP